MPTRRDGGAPPGWLAVVAGLTAAVLALVLPEQLFDTNFYSLWEATALLTGEHPYRDFYEWGVPLQALLSALVQWLVGYRMVGEFLIIHWSFIIAGALLSFDIGYRLTRSLVASVAMALLALEVLPDTPTFHYPKLFFYPLAIWLCWRYMEGPSVRRAVMLGLATAVAFLFRHDHGVYIGVAAVLAFGLARCTVPSSRQAAAMGREATAFAAMAAALVVPWMLVVHLNEGLPEYVRARADLYRLWSTDSPYRSLLSRNPVRLLRESRRPPPRAGVVSFVWDDGTSEARRLEFEQRFGLRGGEGPDDTGRWRYEASNVFGLYGLRGDVHDSQDIDWGYLAELNSWLPTLEPARVWLAQITLFVPFLLLGSACVDLTRSWRRGTSAPPDAYRLVLAGVFLAVVDARLLREASYAHLVAPVTAALCVRFLALAPSDMTADDRRVTGVGLFARARLAGTVALMLVTAVVALACMRPARWLDASTLDRVRTTFARLLVSPPIDAFVTEREAAQKVEGYDWEAWDSGKVPGWPEVLLRYMHDCTRSGDHVLVSGSTPYHLGYLIERPIAGGHLFWYHRWRSDPVREGQSLALIESQSVPFAFSTLEQVLDDLKPYPRIREHFLDHYTPLPGSEGRLLVDARRQPTGAFGPFGFPCFK